MVALFVDKIIDDDDIERKSSADAAQSVSSFHELCLYLCLFEKCATDKLNML